MWHLFGLTLSENTILFRNNHKNSAERFASQNTIQVSGVHKLNLNNGY